MIGLALVPLVAPSRRWLMMVIAVVPPFVAITAPVAMVATETPTATARLRVVITMMTAEVAIALPRVVARLRTTPLVVTMTRTVAAHVATIPRSLLPT